MLGALALRKKRRAVALFVFSFFWLAASCFINLGREMGEPGGGVQAQHLSGQLPGPSAAGAGAVIYGQRAASGGLYCCFMAAGVNGSGKISPSFP